jgi:hypothetical protein
MKHDHNMKVCRRCGETDRPSLLRGRDCAAPMTRGAKKRWLKRPDRPEVLFACAVCVLCGDGFFRLIIDVRRICYGC